MAKYPYDPRAYEERYRKVYEAGAAYWEEPIVTEALAQFLYEFNPPKGLIAIDMGCGEGRDSIFLAEKGLNVTSIDVSQTAVKRAREWAKREGLPIDFLIADVTNLPMKDETFDLAINIACLQMIINQSARDRHLREAYRVLRSRGVYFSCNIGGDEQVSVGEFYGKIGREPGDLIKRKIKVQGKDKEIYLPIIAAWPKSREQYIEEFRNSGFNTLKAYKKETKPLGNCWILITRK